MRKVLAAGFIAAALGVTGCSGSPTYTARGTVASKEVDSECKTAAAKKDKNGEITSPSRTKCTYEYEIDVKQADGSESEEKVTQQHYGRCDVGEPFPECTRG